MYLFIHAKYWFKIHECENTLSLLMTLCCQIYAESQTLLIGHLKFKIYYLLWNFMKYGLHRVQGIRMFFFVSDEIKT